MPQDSVLSPFLFMIFVEKIFEILEFGVYFPIYSDSIILYALGEDSFRTLAKLQNFIDRLVQWFTAYHVSISPEKSVAIDFYRHRPLASTPFLQGTALKWSPVEKILVPSFSTTISRISNLTLSRG